jgi:hypothetical protein
MIFNSLPILSKSWDPKLVNIFGNEGCSLNYKKKRILVPLLLCIIFSQDQINFCYASWCWHKITLVRVTRCLSCHWMIWMVFFSKYTMTWKTLFITMAHIQNFQRSQLLSSHCLFQGVRFGNQRAFLVTLYEHLVVHSETLKEREFFGFHIPQ